MPRSRLEELEQSELDLPVALAWLVRDEIGIDEPDLNAARRRAMFVLAAGGDPHRELDLDSVAAERLASELDTPERRKALHTALSDLPTEDLPNVSEGVSALLSEPEAAWRCLGLALLADELSDD